MMHCSTKDLTLILHPEIGAFDFASHAFENAHLHSQMNIDCRLNGKKYQLGVAPWKIKQINGDKKITTPISEINGFDFTIQTALPGIEINLRLGLCPDYAMALVQMSVANHGKLPLIIDRLTLVDIQPGNLHLSPSNQTDLAFYSNGWQSWSTTGTYGQGEKQRRTRLGFFHAPMVINSGTPQPKAINHFSSDMFGVLGDRISQKALLAGFLSQKSHFGSLEAHLSPTPTLQMWANGDHTALLPGHQQETDWAALSFINLSELEPMQNYLHAVAQTHQLPPQKHDVPVGWCSWYHFYQDINEENILANLETQVDLQDEIPLPLFQIDDGYENYPGDWFDFDAGFPNGLTSLVGKIQKAGLTPGLWMAPFIVHPKAALVKDHPDWLLRDKRGKPANAGFVWNRLTYALDLTNPQALEYACQVVRTAVREWGFEYLKLDFLYAAALDGVYQDPTRTRALVLREGLQALREAVGPEVTMLACGCPLGSALGLFEAMRIGPDVSGYWKPHFPPLSPLFKNEPGMPSACNALQNIVSRAMLHRHWWINDPDCLLIRPDTNLTLAEIQTLATAIGLTGGSILLSDDLPHLPEERLRIAQALLPVIDQCTFVMDWFDKQTPSRLRVDMKGSVGAWYLLAVFNWEDHPATLKFDLDDFRLQTDQTWWWREFWTDAVGKMDSKTPCIFHDVSPHGVRVIAVRPYKAEQPAYLGSNLHLSQGMEVAEWIPGQRNLSLCFDLGHSASGGIDLYLPWQPITASYQGRALSMREKGHGIYSLDLQGLEGQTLQISE